MCNYGTEFERRNHNNPRYKGVASCIAFINTVISPFIKHRATLVASYPAQHLGCSMCLLQDIHLIHYACNAALAICCEMLYLASWEILSLTTKNIPGRLENSIWPYNQLDYSFQHSPQTNRTF